ncbi:MAG: ATP-binding protein [Thermoplasmatota archaeon]
MRIPVALLAILLIPVVLAAVNEPAAWDEGRPLRVGIGSSLEPSTFTLADGTPGGWGVDMMTIGALKANIPVEFVPFDEIVDGVAMLENGTVDVVGIMGSREDLGAFATMNRPWGWTPIVLMTNGAHDWATVDDARGRISTIQGSPIESVIANRFPHMEYVPYSTPAGGVQALANGTIDAYVGPLAIIGHQIQVRQLEQLRPVGDALSLVEVGFWAKTVEATIAVDAIRAAITPDEAQLIYVKWTGFDLSEPSELDAGLPGWVGYTAVALGGLMLLGFVFAFALRRQVREATREIADLNANLEARVQEQTRRLRRVTDRLQTILSASPIGIAVTTPKGDIETANEALGDLLGYSLDELQQGNLSSIGFWANPVDREAILEDVREGKPVRHRLVRLRHKSGTERQAEVTFDLLDVGGKTRILGTAMDVTDREVAREAEAQRKRALEELEVSRKMQQFAVDLINRTAHQLATPLTPLALGVAMLREQLGSEAEEPLELLERNLARLKENLESLTAASNLQAANLSTGAEHIGTETVLATANSLYAGLAEEKQIELTVEGGNHRIIADSSRLQLALGHLVGNAVKFTPSGGQVTLRSRKHDGQVRIEVEDTGPGIAANNLDKLWMPHEQLEESSLADSEGSGMGLFVTRRLIDLEGGTTGCESVEGKGSIFWIELPCADA